MIPKCLQKVLYFQLQWPALAQPMVSAEALSDFSLFHACGRAGEHREQWERMPNTNKVLDFSLLQILQNLYELQCCTNL